MVFTSSRRKQGRKFSFKSNKTISITVKSHFKISKTNNSNTPNSADVIGNSNPPRINIHTKISLNKLITMQEENNTRSSVIINDEMTDEKNTSEELPCQHDNITNEKNRRESIEFERSVLIGTQDITYDYNFYFWDSI